jgi:hypothetical protein
LRYYSQYELRNILEFIVNSVDITEMENNVQLTSTLDVGMALLLLALLFFLCISFLSVSFQFPFPPLHQFSTIVPPGRMLLIFPNGTSHVLPCPDNDSLHVALRGFLRQKGMSVESCLLRDKYANTLQPNALCQSVVDRTIYLQGISAVIELFV